MKLEICVCTYISSTSWFTPDTAVWECGGNDDYSTALDKENLGNFRCQSNITRLGDVFLGEFKPLDPKVKALRPVVIRPLVNSMLCR